MAYEPLWAIGPGKPVPDADYITKVAKFIKSRTGGCPVIYGGGLKEENAGCWQKSRAWMGDLSG